MAKRPVFITNVSLLHHSDPSFWQLRGFWTVSAQNVIFVRNKILGSFMYLLRMIHMHYAICTCICTYKFYNKHFIYVIRSRYAIDLDSSSSENLVHNNYIEGCVWEGLSLSLSLARALS